MLHVQVSIGRGAPALVPSVPRAAPASWQSRWASQAERNGTKTALVANATSEVASCGPKRSATVPIDGTFDTADRGHSVSHYLFEFAIPFVTVAMQPSLRMLTTS